MICNGKRFMKDNSSNVYLVSLSPMQKINRVYGIWWDLINTGTAVLFLTVAFLALSIALMTDQLSALPFQELVWIPFSAQVEIGRRSEIGLNVLGITISGGSAAALYLIRVGTSRWAMNRRIGNIYQFFAEELSFQCTKSQFSRVHSLAVINGLIGASSEIFEHASETHPLAQVYFERARMFSHIYAADEESGNLDAINVAICLYCAATICNKTSRIPAPCKSLSSLVQKSVRKL
jgi:hypothetical protein